MKLSTAQLSVLGVFKTHNIGRRQYLLNAILDSEQLRRPEEIQDRWWETVKELRHSGYIIFDPLGYGLTEKGLAYIRAPSNQDGLSLHSEIPHRQR